MFKVPCLLLLGVFGLASLVNGQVIDLTPVNTIGYEDGTGEVAWKVSNPSSGSDWFSVDFGSDAAGATMVGLWADSAVIGSNGGNQQIGHTTTAGGGFPDLTAAVMQSAQVPGTDGFNSDTGYATPCMDPGTDFHVVYNSATGDSEVWLVSDTDGPVLGRSFFSSDSYATGVPVPFNWRMGYAGFATSIEGMLLINGASSADLDNSDDICMTFTACAPGVVSALYLCAPLFFGPVLPPTTTTTGGILSGPCSNQWTLCTTLTCGDPPGGPYVFCAIYPDPCDTKPNGKPQIKVSSSASLTIHCSSSCGGGCWGQLDDGISDFYIWRIQNPAGTGDWFNVNHGAPSTQWCPPVTQLTGVQLSSWDFCGNGPCWAEVGVYQDDGSGIPLLGTGSTAANPCMAPAAADSGPYPMTTYDIADVAVSFNTAWHVGARWGTGDTCIWIGSDTDGTDSPCGLPVPTAGTTSAFTTDNYASGSIGFSAGNWCMKIDWT